MKVYGKMNCFRILKRQSSIQYEQFQTKISLESKENYVELYLAGLNFFTSIYR